MSSTTQTPIDGTTRNPSTVTNPSPTEEVQAPAVPNKDQEREAQSLQDDNPSWENHNLQMSPYDETQDYVAYEVNDFTVAP